MINCFFRVYLIMSRESYTRSNRPIDYLKSSINEIILIKVKRNRLFRGRLGGFDEHLNLYLEETSQTLSFPPRFGEHNQEIYGQQLGYSDQAIAELKQRGVI